MLVKVEWAELRVGEIIWTSSGAGPYKVFNSQEHLIEESSGAVFPHHGGLKITPIIFNCAGALWGLTPRKASLALRDYAEGKTVDLKEYGQIVGAVFCDFDKISKKEAREMSDII